MEIHRSLWIYHIVRRIRIGENYISDDPNLTNSHVKENKGMENGWRVSLKKEKEASKSDIPASNFWKYENGPLWKLILVSSGFDG